MTSNDIRSIASLPLHSDLSLSRVEIIVLTWRIPSTESQCASAILHNTDHPYRLTLYDNRPNPPNTAKIWNRLVRSSACPYICIMDSDVFVQRSSPCWLSRMMETFAIPDCNLVVPLTSRCSTPAQLQPPRDYPSYERIHGEWSGFCFLFRPALIDAAAAGPFDEDFCAYGQDTEFSIRLDRSLGGAYLRRDVWVEHVHGASFKAAQAIGEYDAAADRAYAQELYLRKMRQR